MDGWVNEWIFSGNVLKAVGDIRSGCEVLSSLSQGKWCLHFPNRFQIEHVLSSSPSKHASHVGIMVPV